MMRINHLIVGAFDIAASEKFYCEVLNYRREGIFTDSGTKQDGVVLTHASGPDLLLVPYPWNRCPSPQHIAFEVDNDDFEAIAERCRKRKVRIRSDAPLDCKTDGVTAITQNGVAYVHFYFCDPSNVNIEIMRKQKV